MSKKMRKWTGLILAAALFSSLVMYFDFPVPGQAAEKQEQLGGQDERAIAADISNMTGITTEEIMQLKQSGMEWNTVLSKLESQQYDVPEYAKARRLQDLVSEGVGEELIEQFAQAGYSRDEVLNAKLAAERVQYQLSGIMAEAASSAPSASLAVAPASGGSPLSYLVETSEKSWQEDRREEYEKLAGAFQVSDAVKWTLLLRESVGGMEQALNEYLEALILNLNLNDYLNSREDYMKQKEEKLATKPLYKAITVQDIEERALLMLQNGNEANRDQLGSVEGASWTGQASQREPSISVLPQPDAPKSTVPEVRNVKPANPAEQMIGEIQSLNPNGPK